MALINKVRYFKRIPRADNKALRDFGGALSMFEYARDDGALPGLEYLDTFMGINPFAAKLPDDVQERWLSRAYRFKRDHHGSFPPFTVFSSFIRDLVAERVEPSFTHFTELPGQPLMLGYPGARYQQRSVMVNKLDILGSKQSTIRLDPTVKCPIHRKGSHALRKC